MSTCELCTGVSEWLCDVTSGHKKAQHTDYYAGAIAQVERRSVLLVGPCIDRRTFAHTVEAYNRARVSALVCFCCAQTNGCIGGDLAGNDGEFANSDIEWRIVHCREVEMRISRSAAADSAIAMIPASALLLDMAC